MPKGRPKQEVTRDYSFRIRMNEEEKSILDKLMILTGKNRSDVVREALKTYYMIKAGECELIDKETI